MAVITVNTARKYKTHAEALNNIFGFNYRQYIKASIKIGKDKCVAFFNLAEEDSHGIWKPPRKSVNWLNIPAKDGSAFIQLELNKKDNAFFNVKVPKQNAIFMWRNGKQGYGYYFYGIFSWEPINKKIGAGIYTRISNKLNPIQWQQPIKGKKKSLTLKK